MQPNDVSSRIERDFLQLEGLAVLVVDDNATNRVILTEVLTGWGARPIAVESGPAALDALRSAAARGESIPIALVDGMMPGMDGFELVERIRGEPWITQVRLLLLTSAGPPEDSARCRALEIAACLTKPVRQSELYRRHDEGDGIFGPPHGGLTSKQESRGAPRPRPHTEGIKRPAGRGPSREPEGGRPHARALGPYGGRRR